MEIKFNAPDWTPGWVKKGWKAAGTFFSGLYEGGKKVVDTVTSANEPEPLREVPRNSDKILYYEELIDAYDDKILDLEDKMMPLQDELDKWEQVRDDLADARLQRLKNLEEIREELKKKEKSRKFFIKSFFGGKGDPMYEKKGLEIDNLKSEQSNQSILPDQNPLVDNPVTGHGPIRLNIYIRKLESELEPMVKKMDHLKEQLHRSEERLKEEEEKEIEKNKI